MASDPAHRRGVATGDRPVLAIYPRVYLPGSMTFVYRQLLGVEEAFDPFVLAYETRNLDRFPFPKVVCHPYTRLDRANRFVARRIGRRASWVPGATSDAFRRELVERGARLIYAHFGDAGIEILPLARELGIPLVVAFHGMDASRYLRLPEYVAALKGLFEYAAAVLTDSKVIADRLVGVGADPARVAVHHLGTDMGEFPYVERVPVRDRVAAGEEISFLQVSNFVEKKGHAFTVQAFRGLLATHPRARLTFAGGGPLRPRIEARCRSLGISDRVTFLGEVDVAQVRRLVRGADVFVHHSVTARSGDEEGIPTAIMEAMASGLVVVTSRHAGIPELVEDGETGFLADERDVPGYEAALRQAMADDGSVGRRAAAFVRRSFDVAVQNERLVSVFRQALRPTTT